MFVTLKFRFVFSFLVLITSGLVLYHPAANSDSHEWQLGANFSAGLSSYQDSDTRKDLFTSGVKVKANYLDSAGVTAGYTYGRLSAESNQPDITENLFFVSALGHYHLDSLDGKLIFRADYYSIDDTVTIETTTTVTGGGMGGGGTQTIITETDFSDTVKVTLPQLGFLNFRKTFYADIGYAFSSYEFEDTTIQDVEVDQWTPTIGFSWNEKYDWLQSRFYLIRLSDGANTAGVTSNEAVELKWTRWLKPPGKFNIDSFTFSLLLGERVFAVDPDTNAVYSFAHQQTGLASLGVSWKLSDELNVMTYIGHVRYTDLVLQNDYTSNDFYINFYNQW